MELFSPGRLGGHLLSAIIAWGMGGGYYSRNYFPNTSTSILLCF